MNAYCARMTTTNKPPKVYVPPSIPHKRRYDQRLSVYLSLEQQSRLAALVRADGASDTASDCVRRLIDQAFMALPSGAPQNPVAPPNPFATPK